MDAKTYYLAGIGIYLGFITWIFVQALRKSRGEDRNIAFEAVGARRFAAPLIGILIAEAMLGPADALALSQNGFRYGIAWIIFPLGAALAQAVAGLFFVRRIHDQFPGRLSLGDIFAERCGTSARGIVGLVAFAQAVAFSGVLVLAGGQILESLVGIDRTYGMILTAVVVGVFTSLGGIGVVVDTNKLQAVFAWSLVVLALIGIGYLATSKGASPSAVITTSDFFKDHSLKISIALFVAYFMGELLLPAYAIRALLADSARSAQRGFLFASLLLVIWYLVIATAGAMGRFIPAEARGSTDNAILLDVIRVAVPAGSVLWHVLGAIVAAGLLALIHSTFNAFLNSGAVALARDVIGIGVRNERVQGVVERWSVLVIAALGVLVALQGDSLIGLLLIGYTIWVPTLLPPFAWILFNPTQKLSTGVFIAALAAGGVGFWIFEYGLTTFIPGILAGFLLNLAVIIIGRALVGRRALDSRAAR